MNLKQSLTLEALSKPQKETCLCKAAKVSASQVAKQVFAAAVEEGAPYEGITYKEWAKRWLASDEFVLTEIEASAVAVPSLAVDNHRVMRTIKASQGAIAPIVVDVNKRGIGRAPGSGYTPPVIVVEGRDRHVAQVLQGRMRLQAWVGARALKRLVNAQAEVTVKRVVPAPQSRMDTTAQLYAGMNGTPVPRQDVGDGGSQPTMRMPSVKSTGKAMEPYTKGQKPEVQAAHKTGCDCDACSDKMRAAGGAGGGGATGGPGGSTSGMNPLNKMYSKVKVDKMFTKVKAATNQTSTAKDKDNDDPPTGSLTDVDVLPKSPSKQSPGSGGGARLGPSTGGSKSEMSKVKFDSPNTLGTNRHKGGASNSEMTKILAGGPGSGRYPKGSHQEKESQTDPSKSAKVTRLREKLKSLGYDRVTYNSRGFVVGKNSKTGKAKVLSTV